MKTLTRNEIDRLTDIKNEMISLLNEAKGIIRLGPAITQDRAKGYCLAQLEMALTNEHGYLGSATVSLENVIDELESNLDGESESED